MQTVPKARLDALTGLRFFAALAVYLHHHPKPDYLPGTLTTFFLAGYNGVTLFFVLSGFVIGFNYFDSLVKPTGKKLLSVLCRALGTGVSVVHSCFGFGVAQQECAFGPQFHLARPRRPNLVARS